MRANIFSGSCRSTLRRSLRPAGVLLLLAAGLLGSPAQVSAQVPGGQFAFEFLRMPQSPHLSALGGISVANPGNDISLAAQNPALMRPGLHNQLQLNYNGFYSGIRIMNLQYGYHAPRINTSFVLGVQYLNYGEFTRTTANGTVDGNFAATDYAVTLGAARKYGEHWRYGAAAKVARSTLDGQMATAALVDVGINYYDTTYLLDIGAVAKNMGVMLGSYGYVGNEPMPFDLQLGVSKRFKHLPLRLFTTLHHLYEWDIRYNNPADNARTTLSGIDTTAVNKSNFSEKLFRHFIFGAEITLGKRIVLTGAYNVLRRRELALSTITGLAGFSFGAGIHLDKFSIQYGRSFYHISGPYNEIGITMHLNKLFGLGQTGERMAWNVQYPDWD